MDMWDFLCPYILMSKEGSSWVVWCVWHKARVRVYFISNKPTEGDFNVMVHVEKGTCILFLWGILSTAGSAFNFHVVFKITSIGTPMMLTHSLYSMVKCVFIDVLLSSLWYSRGQSRVMGCYICSWFVENTRVRAHFSTKKKNKQSVGASDIRGCHTRQLPSRLPRPFAASPEAMHIHM